MEHNSFGKLCRNNGFTPFSIIPHGISVDWHHCHLALFLKKTLNLTKFLPFCKGAAINCSQSYIPLTATYRIYYEYYCSNFLFKLCQTTLMPNDYNAKQSLCETIMPNKYYTKLKQYLCQMTLCQTALYQTRQTPSY